MAEKKVMCAFRQGHEWYWVTGPSDYDECLECKICSLKVETIYETHAADKVL